MLQDFQELSTQFPNEPRYLDKVAGALVNVGVVRYEMGYADESTEPFTAAAQLYTDLIRVYGAMPAYQEGLASALDGLGQTFLDLKHDAQDAILCLQKGSKFMNN